MLTNILERRTRRFKWYAAWKLKRFLLANKVDLVIDVDTIHALWTYRAIKIQILNGYLGITLILLIVLKVLKGCKHYSLLRCMPINLCYYQKLINRHI